MPPIYFSKRLRYLGREYHFQTTFNENEGSAVCSIFNEGKVLDMKHVPVPEDITKDGIVEYILKIHDDILKSYEDLLKIAESRNNPDRADVGIKLSAALMAKRLYDEALELLDSGNGNRTDNSAVRLLRGKLFLAKNMPENAEVELKQAVELSPDYPDIRNLLGETYLSLKRPMAAVAQFKEAVQLNIYYHRAFYNLGLAYILNGLVREDFETAREIQNLCRESFEKATLLNPGYDCEEFRTALKKLQEGSLQEAYDLLGRVLDDRVTDLAFDSLLEDYVRSIFGDSGITEENIKAYIERIETLLAVNPGYADLQNELGMAYTIMGKIMSDKAMDHFKLALDINPRFRKALKNLKLSENELRGFDVLLEAILK